MHPSSVHRARIVEAPAAHAHDTRPLASPQLRRQAALFQAHRDRLAAEESASAHEPDAAPDTFAQADALTDMRPDVPLFAERVESDQQHTPDDGASDDDGDASGESGSEDSGTPHRAVADTRDGGATPQMHVDARLHPVSGPRAAGPRAESSSAAHDATEDPPAPARVVDFIVSRVAGFCANPAVLARGHWHITIAIDPALLPGCKLSLTLSHFALSLRFDLSCDHSRYLISQHEASLRDRLDELMQSRSDGPYSIDIIVT
ncbi:type III secretion system protein SctP [Paraburkholderia sp. 2C]|jgi:type III secretion control protein HpaP